MLPGAGDCIAFGAYRDAPRWEVLKGGGITGMGVGSVYEVLYTVLDPILVIDYDSDLKTRCYA